MGLNPGVCVKVMKNLNVFDLFSPKRMWHRHYFCEKHNHSTLLFFRCLSEKCNKTHAQFAQFKEHI